MAINSLTTSNTFANWLTATNSLIGQMNNLTDGNKLNANTMLLLTYPDVSLNVRNVAVINTLTSNTITANNILVIGPAGSLLNVTTNAVFATANVIGDVSVQNLTVRGTQTLSSVTFTNLDLSGYVNAAGYISTSTYFNQLGANATFAGNVYYTNTVTSIFTLGNVTVRKIITAANLSLLSGGIITTPYLTISSNVIGNTYFTNNVAIQGSILTTNGASIGGNTTISGFAAVASNLSVTSNASVGGDLSVTGNTSIGPYTELVSDLGSISTNQNLNLRNASVFRANIGASLTLTLINPPAAGRAVSTTIFLRQGTGGSTITLRGNTSTGVTGNLRYAYDTAPTLNTVINMVNILSAFTIDGGFNWYVSAPIIGSNTA